MIQANFTIPIAEFNIDLVEKIKALLAKNGSDAEVFISIRPRQPAIWLKETKEEYITRLSRAKDNVENNENLVAFTSEEFEDLVQKMKAEGHGKSPV